MTTRTLWVLALGVTVFTINLCGQAEAQLEPPRRPGVDPGSEQSAQLASRAAQAEIAGNPEQALKLAEEGIRADANDPWPHYNRACALASLHRVDEAVASYERAEQQFSAADQWGKSVAIYGRANVLREAGRCDEANRAFADFIVLVQSSDPKGASMAHDYATKCRQGSPAAAAARVDHATSPVPTEPQAR
jgi:tetratricopeptide (TPR) repeat protein